MNSWLAVLVALGAVAAPDPDPVQKEIDRLQGSYQLVTAERGGMPLARPNTAKMTITGQTITITPEKGDKGVLTFTLNPNRNPKVMKLTQGDQTSPAIYMIYGEYLKICFHKEGKKPPAEFSSPPNTDLTFFICKRIKQ